MSKQTEALKLALNKAFQLGQRYWSWSDSEYSSHWKKADAAKAEFDKLVENTYEAIANDHENPVQIDPSAGTQISKVWWDGDKLMAKPIPLESIYKEPEQPSQQEPFAWADLNTLTAQFNSVNCGTAYRLPGEGRQPLYTSPPASKPWVGLTEEQIAEIAATPCAVAGSYVHTFARAIEAKLLEKNT